MKYLILFLYVSCSFGFEYHENPNKPLSTKNNFTNETSIYWEQTDNIQKRCEEESKTRGMGGFGYPVEACSFWGKRLNMDVCHIITPKKVSLATMGHEFFHCFAGDFHKKPK